MARLFSPSRASADEDDPRSIGERVEVIAIFGPGLVFIEGTIPPSRVLCT